MAIRQEETRLFSSNGATPSNGRVRDLHFLDGGGEMGERVRALDWRRTALGPVEAWPQSLRTAVSICLRSRFPSILWWGEDLTAIYNDASIPILVGKHPNALGAPGLSRDVCGDSEARAVIGPMLRSVIEQGDATWLGDQLLILERNGVPEEAYFTWSFSPIHDESGKVGGVFTAVTETTDKIIGERRIEMLRDLADRALEAKTTDEAYANIAAVLTEHPRAAALAEIDPAKTAFFSNISPELRTMLLKPLEDALRDPRAQARLASENERKRLYELFMQAPAIIAVLRGPQHIFELANPTYLRVVGRDGDIIGMCVKDAIPEVEAQDRIAVLDRVYRTGEPYIGNEVPIKLDRHRDGNLEERAFNVVHLPYRGADGAIQGILVHAVDVTDQVRARRRVEEQNRVLEMITQGVPLGEALDQLVLSIEHLATNGMRASVLLLDSDGTHLRHGAAPNLPDAYNAAIDGIAIGPSVGSCGTAAYTRAPVIVSDIATDPRWAEFKDLAGTHDLRACWSTPIFSAAGDVLGTFAMYYNEPQEPSAEDRQLIAFATRTTALLIERMRAEEALRISEQHFREMIDALPAAIYTTDAEGRLTHFNPAAVAFSGRVPELGTDQWCVSWKLYYPDGTPMPHDECPMAVALKEGRIITGAEAIAERPDGTRVWFTPYPTPLRDSTGRIIGGINMLMDITERKRSEEMRARLAAIVESSDDAIVSKDLNGIIMTWNKGAERIFGYTAAEAIGQPITILIPPDRLDEEPEILRRIRRGERIDHIETVRRRKDGALLDISLTISPVVDGRGKIVGASKIARDITERRALERQKDAFIGIAAHELRTPVTGIKGYTQLLARRLRRVGDLSSAETLDKLDAQANRLTGLIDDLLDVTRIDSGMLPLRSTAFDLDALLTEVSDEVQRTTERHTIVREGAGGITLVGDRDRVGQVVTNLLTNAIKYSPEAERIVVRTARDGESVVVAVQDFGIGIPKEDQPQIFDRFYRVDAGNRAGYGGLGLGLYIAAEFIKRHGGTIKVESAEGEGTTIAFSLPLNGSRERRAAVVERQG